MGSQIGSKTNVKIYVLNLMMAVGYPLDFNTLNEALRQTDFIDYFDFADAFHTMEDDGLLEASGVNRLGEPCYAVTAKGACVVESMRGNILPSVLEDSVVCAMRYLDFKHRGGQAVLPDRTVCRRGMPCPLLGHRAGQDSAVRDTVGRGRTDRPADGGSVPRTSGEHVPGRSCPADRQCQLPV